MCYNTYMSLLVVPDSIPFSDVINNYRFKQVANLKRELNKTIDYVDFYILSVALNNNDHWEERDGGRCRHCS